MRRACVSGYDVEMTTEQRDAVGTVDLIGPRQGTTQTVPRTQHKWVRDYAYDHGYTQSAVYAACVAVASQHPETLAAILTAAREDAQRYAGVEPATNG